MYASVYHVVHTVGVFVYCMATYFSQLVELNLIYIDQYLFVCMQSDWHYSSR